MLYITESLDVVLKDYPTDGLLDFYREPQRRYHTELHIEYILLALRDMNYTFGFSEKMLRHLHLLAWYHDLVYIPGSKTNESDSAAVWHIDWEDFWHDRNDAVDIQNWNDGLGDIKAAILDTANHRNPSSWLSACFMDLDLAGLGSTWSIYKSNGEKVRAEFDVSDTDWKIGRGAFLKDFLGRPNIFHTAWGRPLEKKARKNMKRELEEL